MRVKQLIDKLQSAPPNAVVLLTTDAGDYLLFDTPKKTEQETPPPRLISRDGYLIITVHLGKLINEI
jgi:hypothetical protein